MRSDQAASPRSARTSVVVPTLNAARHMPDLAAALARLADRPARVLFIDSGSSDGTVEQVRAAGHELHVIARADFGHGRTRNLAARLCPDSDYIVYLTQDACPQGDNWLAELLAPFDDEHVALVYGRQLPRPGAGLAERYAREFNYPAQPDRTVLADVGVRGVKAVYCSNSFAAYRRSALEAVGGFPELLPLGEDMSVALRLLQRGYARVYQPLALAVHSHHYGVADEFKRYFDIGTLMAMDAGLQRASLATAGEGWRYARGEFALAWREGRVMLLPLTGLRVVAKAAGFALGRRYRMLPQGWRRRLSMHRYFWSA